MEIMKSEVWPLTPYQFDFQKLSPPKERTIICNTYIKYVLIYTYIPAYVIEKQNIYILGCLWNKSWITWGFPGSPVF